MIKHFIQSILALILISFPVLKALSQSISTIGEIYNYEIGDEFHLQGFYSSPNYDSEFKRINKIANKFYSQEGDTLFYEIDYQYAYTTNSTGWIYEDSTINLYYTNLDSLIYEGEIDSVYSIPSLYNGRIVNVADYLDGTIHYIKKFANGCGLVLYYSQNSEPWNMHEHSNSLVYFNKNNEEWGQPIIITKNPEYNLSELFITLYPNPARNQIQLEINVKTADLLSISIFSIKGKVVKDLDHINERSIRVDISDLNPGAYILSVVTVSNIFQSKFIKQ